MKIGFSSDSGQGCVSLDVLRKETLVKSPTSYRFAALVVLAVAAALAVVVFVGGGTGIAQGRTSAARGVADDALTVHIASPEPDAQVTQPFELQLESNVPLGAPETGLHHVHLYYDTATP